MQNAELIRENAELRARLDEAEETLRAIRNGEVDALVVAGEKGDQVYTLQGAERSYRVLMETISEGAATLAPDCTILYCNGQFARLLNASLESLIGSPVLNWISPKERPGLKALIDRRADTVVRKEMVFVRDDGSTVPVLVGISTLDLGQLQGVSLLATDLTENKAVEERLRRAHDLLEERVRERTIELTQTNAALQASEEKFAMAFAENPAAIAMTRLEDGTFLEVNDTWVALLGYSRAEVIGISATRLPIWPTAGARDQFVAELKEQGSLRGREQEFCNKSGKVFVVQLSAQVMKVRGETVILSTLVDITERKRAENALRQSETVLERLVAERTEKLQELVAELEHFSYSITHDMRAPLRSMRGYADLALELMTRSPEERPKEYLRRIAVSAERMDTLITDALSYTKTVSQNLQLAPVDLAELLRGMLDSYPEFQPAKARIHLEGDFPTIVGNQAALTQCFSNLLGNAVKFVPPGKTPEIRIWAETAAATEVPEHQSELSSINVDSANLCRIWVEDNGIGISPTMLPRVFNMFSRGTNEYEGTGIGLALVRKVVDRMGGRVGVESELGKGSRFWVELQRCAPSQLPP